MPIYEFVCNKCGNKFECLIRGTGDAAECPGCRSRDLKKLISGFAFNSKGKDALPGGSHSSSCGGCSGGNCSSCSR